MSDWTDRLGMVCAAFVACALIVAVAYTCNGYNSQYSARASQCITAGGSWVPTNSGGVCIAAKVGP